jgi:hypothetical protein
MLVVAKLITEDQLKKALIMQQKDGGVWAQTLSSSVLSTKTG